VTKSRDMSGLSLVLFSCWACLERCTALQKQWRRICYYLHQDKLMQVVTLGVLFLKYRMVRLLVL
jgi:hypothetical protein